LPAYHNPIAMSPFVLAKLTPATEARRTNVNAISCFADRVCAFHSNGVGQIACARIALGLNAGLIDGCESSETCVREHSEKPTEDLIGEMLSVTMGDGHSVA
jgi:hypothetical protein